MKSDVFDVMLKMRGGLKDECIYYGARLNFPFDVMLVRLKREDEGG
jgi:hypothetical protein